MKISITELETARRNPVAFKAAHSGPAVFHRMKLSSYRLWQLATRHIHAHHEGLDRAIAALEESFGRNLKVCKRNEQLLEDLVDKLVAYHDDFTALNHYVIETAKRITISPCSDVIVTGEIPRIDLVPSGGYAVYFFIKESGNWQAELRMPLIQSLCAGFFGCPLSEVLVGVYVFSENRHESVSFDISRLTLANTEFTSLIQQLR
ncbi:MAG: hypothetical protein NT011_06985 [Kiritimatiellaeota bacterium]|nr:hypothetical protein [Kiritimatiellota bacterium]